MALFLTARGSARRSVRPAPSPRASLPRGASSVAPGPPGVPAFVRLIRRGVSCARAHARTIASPRSPARMRARAHAPLRPLPRLHPPAVAPASPRVRVPVRSGGSRAVHLGLLCPAQPDFFFFFLKSKCAFPANFPSGVSFSWLAAGSVLIRIHLTSLSVRPSSLEEGDGASRARQTCFGTSTAPFIQRQLLPQHTLPGAFPPASARAVSLITVPRVPFTFSFTRLYRKCLFIFIPTKLAVHSFSHLLSIYS